MSMPNDEATDVQLTHEQLLAKAVSVLESDTQTDTSLLKILSEYIVKQNPKSTAVSDAVRKIEALAQKRAEESEDAPADHD